MFWKLWRWVFPQDVQGRHQRCTSVILPPRGSGISSPVTPSHCLLTAARSSKINPPAVTHDDVTTAGNAEQTSVRFSNVTWRALTTDQTPNCSAPLYFHMFVMDVSDLSWWSHMRPKSCALYDLYDIIHTPWWKCLSHPFVCSSVVFQFLTWQRSRQDKGGRALSRRFLKWKNKQPTIFYQLKKMKICLFTLLKRLPFMSQFSGKVSVVFNRHHPRHNTF